MGACCCCCRKKPPPRVTYVVHKHKKNKNDKRDLRKANSLVLLIKDYHKAEKVEDLIESMEKARAKRFLGAELDLDEPTGQPNIDRQLKVAMRIGLGSHVALRNQVIVYWNAINRKYPSGDGLLHIVCREGYLKMVEFIIDPKNHSKLDTTELEVDLRNRKSRTPLHLCFTPPQATFVAKVHGFDANGNLQSVMPDDVQMVVDWVKPGRQKEREKIIECLLEKQADPNAADFHDYTPLHYAAMYGWLETVKKLVECKARIDVGNIAGETPLMLASLNGHEEVVEFLTEDADPPATVNVKDTNNANALFYAVKAKNAVIAEHLLDLGAEPDLESISKDTPLRLACKENQGEIINMLLNANVKRDQEAFELLKGDVKESIGRRIALEEKEAKEAAELQKQQLKDQEQKKLAAKEDREAQRAVGVTKVKPFPKSAYGQWVPYIDKGTHQIFYYNKVSRQTQWDIPKDYVKDKSYVMKKATFGMHFYH
mmetsp:Transcript_31092/g.41123  ORF Transcript_31092/g.41123 Transcript_31092/m.41123 type:complete len:484 (-) Transcript_31092:292-1743(-)|eukprot:CAMPEP_0117740484 /NCGR_PEP_ID=MMETSP0947-20121206/4370_1 /TAXON_ID=44440 /ORGANISM="Chattonella subsalsa, Strain CCMP2191" /LENGTH=483 /DNA_ID=CAMNT_0005556609 /DNA_START=149 /DNA_END=1600 /DNA_ORIENTATION=+